MLRHCFFLFVLLEYFKDTIIEERYYFKIIITENLTFGFIISDNKLFQLLTNWQLSC